MKKVIVSRISTGYKISYYNGDVLLWDNFDTVYAEEEYPIPEGFENYGEWSAEKFGADYENTIYTSPEQTT